MLFRNAGESDLGALMEFYGQISDAMIGTPFDCRWRRGEHPDEKMVSDAVSAGELTIADDEGAIAAAVIVDHSFDESTAPGIPWTVACAQDEAAVVHVLAAAPAYRGTGIARELLLHVIDTARSQNMRTVRLGVAINNTPAVKLYESCGFTPIIVAKRFWGGILVDAMTMELPL